MIKGVNTLYNEQNLGACLAKNANKKYWSEFAREKQISKINQFLSGIEENLDIHETDNQDRFYCEAS